MKILTWIYNHVPTKVWDEFNYTFPNFKVQPLKFGNRLVISSTLYDAYDYLSMLELQLSVSVKGALDR